MAWVTINNRSGTATKWQYDNNPTDPGVSPLRAMWLKQASGVRGFPYSGTHQHEVYVSCRRIDNHTKTGEMSKTYFDNLND